MSILGLNHQLLLVDDVASLASKLLCDDLFNSLVILYCFQLHVSLHELG